MILFDRNSHFMVRAVQEELVIKTIIGYRLFYRCGLIAKNDYKHVSSSLTVSEIYFDEDAIFYNVKNTILFP